MCAENIIINFIKNNNCLQHCKAIKNDNNCVKIVAQKFVDRDNPRIEFKLIEV